MGPKKGRITVLHLGPDPRSTGGMASVISELCATRVDGVSNLPLVSWRPDRPLKSFDLGLLSLCKLVLWRRRSRNVVVHGHVSERGSLLREGLVLRAAHLLGYTTVVTLHGAELNVYADSNRALTGLLNVLDCVFCLGPRTADAVKALRADARVQVIYNPVSVPDGGALAEHTEPPMANASVLFAGEIGERKGFDLLAEGWSVVAARHRSARLIVCGPVAEGYGGLKPSQLENCDYKGEMRRSEVLDLMGNVTLVCLPSRAEVLPMVILEALARGVRVVTTAVGEYEQFEGAPGVRLLQSSPSSGELAAALLAELSSDEPRTSLESVKWARSTFSPEVVETQLVEVYRQLLIERDLCRNRRRRSNRTRSRQADVKQSTEKRRTR